MDFLSHGKLQEAMALQGLCTCQPQMHLLALTGDALWGNIDGQALLREYIKILLVNLTPDVHCRLLEKMSSSCWPTGNIPASALPFWCPNDQWVFLLIRFSKGEHDPVLASCQTLQTPQQLEAGRGVQPSSHRCSGKSMTWQRWHQGSPSAPSLQTEKGTGMSC